MTLRTDIFLCTEKLSYTKETNQRENVIWKLKQELPIGFYWLNWWMSDVLLMSKKQFAASFQVVHEKDARQGIAASCKSQLARPKQDPAR